MLSNTAVPTEYGAFREKVKSREIPVCEEISLQMQRIDALIADPNVWYDDQAIVGFTKFVEREMTLTDGKDVNLLPVFKLWAEDLLAWKIYVNRPQWDEGVGAFVMKRILKRLHDTQYLIVARGSAKSMYVAFLQAYFLTVDTSSTQQVTIAPTMKMAEEAVVPIRIAIQRSKGPLFKLLTYGSMQNTTGTRLGRQKLASTKKGIENFATTSLLEIRALSVDKLQGGRWKYISLDEWLSGDTRENPIPALMQSGRKHEDPILVAISSEGTVRNGVGDDIKMELAKILRGESLQWNVSIWHYKLDDIKEVGIPQMWPKCNPNIGITVSYDTYKQDVEKIEMFPHLRNEILAKRFGLPMEGFTFFFTYEETLPTFPYVNPTRYAGQECTLGIDLSRGDDFCAFTFLFPLGGGRFGLKSRAYITRRTLDLLPGARRQKYQEFIDEGTLFIFEGNMLDMMDVYDDLYEHIQQLEYNIFAVGYDVYNADAFMERYMRDWGPHGIHKVIQGARTESVPLGEMKTLVASKSVEFDEKIIMYTMGHAVAKEDLNGNRMLVKLRGEEKIDNVSAWMDAHVAYKKDPEQFD
jgi:phage terminase large subunit-like protein